MSPQHLLAIVIIFNLPQCLNPRPLEAKIKATQTILLARYGLRTVYSRTMKEILIFSLSLLAAGSVIALMGAWLGARLASGITSAPSLKGLFRPKHPEEKTEIEYPTVMSARDAARASGEERPDEVMPQAEEDAPMKPSEETDIYPA